MCLIVLGWRVLPDFPLVVAANRDEFHRRPAAPAAFWSDRPSILAGRDLEAGGTWMGLARNGRFAAVTNYRGAREPRAVESRGALVTKFLEGSHSPAKYIEELKPSCAAYSGFNLLATDGAELWWLSNRGGNAHRLEPGIYGLGNTLLDAPEVEDAKRRFEAAIRPAPAVEPLFEELGRARIVNPEYGTRCSTVLLKRSDGRIRYAERSFSPDGAAQDTVHYAL
jgi:uncharacterized protein with NRDE domain